MTAPTDQHDSVCKSTFASTKEHSDEGQPRPSETTTSDTTTPPWDPCSEERCDVVEEQHSLYTESKTTQSKPCVLNFTTSPNEHLNPHASAAQGWRFATVTP